MRLQSAMEYLMTYGWAILIIAVVLIGLNYLGVFNSETFAPKASPGACYVLRTAAEVSLAGECNNYIPRSVAQFNGQTSTVSIPNNPSLQLNGAFTISFWQYIGSVSATGYDGSLGMGNAGAGNTGYIIFYGTGVGTAAFNFKRDNMQFGFDQIAPTGVWKYYTATYGNSALNLYINGVETANYIATFPTDVVTSNLIMGWTDNNYGNQSLADVQFYNSSLSASTIQSMYAEGIGGAPINLQNLIGWWPLNGDVVDYSGNGNNGVNNNVAFNSYWYTTYTPT